MQRGIKTRERERAKQLRVRNSSGTAIYSNPRDLVCVTEYQKYAILQASQVSRPRESQERGGQRGRRNTSAPRVKKRSVLSRKFADFVEDGAFLLETLACPSASGEARSHPPTVSCPVLISQLERYKNPKVYLIRRPRGESRAH